MNWRPGSLSKLFILGYNHLRCRVTYLLHSSEAAAPGSVQCPRIYPVAQSDAVAGRLHPCQGCVGWHERQYQLQYAEKAEIKSAILI